VQVEAVTPESVVGIGQQALQVTALISAPMLLAALIVGVLIGMFQAATQINEMTLSFIPKLLALVVVLVVAGSWMLRVLVEYTERLIGSIPFLIG
jgi:flagellar biosynthetic protein FliQ